MRFDDIRPFEIIACNNYIILSLYIYDKSHMISTENKLEFFYY